MSKERDINSLYRLSGKVEGLSLARMLNMENVLYVTNSVKELVHCIQQKEFTEIIIQLHRVTFMLENKNSALSWSTLILMNNTHHIKYTVDYSPGTIMEFSHVTITIPSSRIDILEIYLDLLHGVKITTTNPDFNQLPVYYVVNK